jgi:hypothetical protein
MLRIDRLHRALVGSPISRGELIAGAIFVAVWFLMDLHQYIDWLITPACK